MPAAGLVPPLPFARRSEGLAVTVRLTPGADGTPSTGSISSPTDDRC